MDEAVIIARRTRANVRAGDALAKKSVYASGLAHRTEPRLTAPFADRLTAYRDRSTRCLERLLPPAGETPSRLHEAMRYAVLNGGKRIRPLLAYASAECLGVAPEKVDGAAAAIELIHAFSLVHDDLPAMDNDDLRRGLPTVHRKYDEATAILAADALQPLAFAAIAGNPATSAAEAVCLIRLVSDACGSRGMTGGQSIDLQSEGRRLSEAELRHMNALKTGALISAAVMSAACIEPRPAGGEREGLQRYADDVGLAFQVRDDILDVEGETSVIGKPAGSDVRSGKATWPALFGIERARQHCDELLESGLAGLQVFGARAEPLRWLAHYIVQRAQ